MPVTRKKVHLKLGIFNVDVDVMSALDSSNKPISLNQICVGTPGKAHAPAQTRQSLACPACDNDDKGTFARGKTMSGDQFVIVPDEVLEQAGAENDTVATSIELKPHPREQIGRLFNGDKCYFLVPNNAAQAEAYACIADALTKRPELAFVSTWAARTAQSFWLIEALDGRLVMKQLAWPGAVNALPEVPTQYDEKKFGAMAQMLIDSMLEDYDPAVYVDTKSKVIVDYIDTAVPVAGADVADPTAAPSAPVDLEAQLKLALAAATAGKAPLQAMPAEQPANVERIAAPRKTTAPRKRAVKKAVAKVG